MDHILSSAVCKTELKLEAVTKVEREHDIITSLGPEDLAIPNFTFAPVEPEPEPPNLVRCFMCGSNFNGRPEASSDDASAVINNEPVLNSLCRILKIRKFQEILKTGKYKDVHVPAGNSSMLCPDCGSLVSQAISLEEEIKKLQTLLASSVERIRSVLSRPSEITNSETSDEARDYMHVCRKSLHQVLSPCKVRLQQCNEAESQAREVGNRKNVTGVQNQCPKRRRIRPASKPACRMRRKRKTDIINTEASARLPADNSAGVAKEKPDEKHLSDPDFDPDNESAGENDDGVDITNNHCSNSSEQLKFDSQNTDRENGYSCKICGKTFPGEINLKIHQSRKHGINHDRRKFLPNQCQFCGKEFKEPEPAVESNKKPVYVCNPEECDCGNTYATLHLFKYHHYRRCPKRLEEAELERLQIRESYVCKLCGKKFEQASNLRYHHLSVHEQKFKYYCEICGHGTQVPSMLKRHMLVHSEEKTVKCDQCDYRCKRPVQLFYHKRIHTNEKPHLCSECGKSFISNSKLQQHAAVHLNSKDVPCPTCGKLFACKQYVTNHINEAHKRNPRKAPKKRGKAKASAENQSIPIEPEPDILRLDSIHEAEIGGNSDMIPTLNQVTVQLVDGAGRTYDILSAEPTTFVEIG